MHKDSNSNIDDICSVDGSQVDRLECVQMESIMWPYLGKLTG